MKDFIKKVIEGNRISPSEVCGQSFNDNFADAINVEWLSKEGNYEAIFYKNSLEYIALFSLLGVLLEYRQNLPPEYLPEPIKKLALSRGEIMNAVLKNKGNMLEYELIVRDKLLKRHLIVITDMGVLKEEKAL